MILVAITFEISLLFLHLRKMLVQYFEGQQAQELVNTRRMATANKTCVSGKN